MRLEDFFSNWKQKKSWRLFPTSVPLKQCSGDKAAWVTRVRKNPYSENMKILIKQVKSQLQTHGKPFITDPIIFISWKTPTATDLVDDCYGKLKCVKSSIVITPTQLGVTPCWCCVYATYSMSHWKWCLWKQMRFLNAWNAAFQNCVLCWRFSIIVEPRSLIWRTFFISTSLCNFSALLILHVKWKHFYLYTSHTYCSSKISPNLQSCCNDYSLYNIFQVKQFF